MLITFSQERLPAGELFGKELRFYPQGAVVSAAGAARAEPAIAWVRGLEVRFTLPGATTAQHESVILALLTLDPRATIRTARARYAGLADYQRQHPAAVTVEDGVITKITIANPGP